MSGNENYDKQKTVKQRMSVIDEALNEYEQKHKLPQLKSPCKQEEIEQYFTMNRNVIEKLSREDCSQIAYRLSQFSFYVQRLYNREQARIAWAQTNLDDIIGEKSTQYDKYTKYEAKVALIKKTDSSAKALGQIVVYAEQRSQRLAFLAKSITNLSDVMIANQRSKYEK